MTIYGIQGPIGPDRLFTGALNGSEDMKPCSMLLLLHEIDLAWPDPRFSQHHTAASAGWRAS